MRVLDLFSGIGGFSLGLERTGGFETTSFCEIDPYCRKVLRKHWLDVPIHDDVTKREFIEGEADVITAGFPCQDISYAGKGAGITGERSGLWREVVRAIRVVRPRYTVLENVAALLNRGLGNVLGTLAEIGHDAEWDCIPASAVGAPHRRDRWWCVAYPRCISAQVQIAGKLSAIAKSGSYGPQEPVADTGRSETERCGSSEWQIGQRDWWSIEPDVGRVAHGIPSRVDRLKGLGNAVVPQIPELIGRAILETA